MTQETLAGIPALEQSSERHPLPSGGWVEIRALHTLRAKHAKMCQRNVNVNPSDPDIKVMAYAVDMGDALLEMMILAWHIPYEPDWPIPNHCVMRDPETNCPVVLDELRPEDYSALQRICVPAQRKLFAKPVTPDDADKPGSPGEPASA